MASMPSLRPRRRPRARAERVHRPPARHGGGRAARPGPRPRRGAARRRRALRPRAASSRASSAPSCSTRPSSRRLPPPHPPRDLPRRPLLLRHPGRRARRPRSGGGDAPQRRGRAGLVVAHARLPADDRGCWSGSPPRSPRRSSAAPAAARSTSRAGSCSRRSRSPSARCSRRSSTTTCGRGTSERAPSGD